MAEPPCWPLSSEAIFAFIQSVPGGSQVLFSFLSISLVKNSAGTAISFILSEPANPASLTSTSFVVNGNFSGVHQGAITLNEAGTVATFVPNQRFIHIRYIIETIRNQAVHISKKIQ